MIELRIVVESSENKSGLRVKTANHHLTTEKRLINSAKRKRSNDLNIFEETMLMNRWVGVGFCMKCELCLPK